jgi:ABC-type transport system involved in cytochrome c biogenesis permease component
MIHSLKIIQTLIVKDWRTELRDWQIVPLVVVMALAAVMLFHLTGLRLGNSALGWAAILWLITLLDLVIILDRALAADTHNGALEAMLAGAVSPIQYLVAKLAFAGAILLILQAFILVLLRTMLSLAIQPEVWRVALSLVLADAGLLLVGLICSLIAILSHRRATLLAGMLWPMSLPIVLLAVLSLDPLGRYENGWLILAGFDIVMAGLWPGLIKLITGK